MRTQTHTHTRTAYSTVCVRAHRPLYDYEFKSHANWVATSIHLWFVWRWHASLFHSVSVNFTFVIHRNGNYRIQSAIRTTLCWYDEARRPCKILCDACNRKIPQTIEISCQPKMKTYENNEFRLRRIDLNFNQKRKSSYFCHSSDTKSTQSRHKQVLREIVALPQTLFKTNFKFRKFCNFQPWSQRCEWNDAVALINKIAKQDRYRRAHVVRWRFKF